MCWHNNHRANYSAAQERKKNTSNNKPKTQTHRNKNNKSYQVTNSIKNIVIFKVKND
jgi:hypothetical protein